MTKRCEHYWRAVETAPFDEWVMTVRFGWGAPILARQRGYPPLWIDSVGCRIPQPTHWMPPLPPPEPPR